MSNGSKERGSLTPAVSVVIPLFNGESFIQAALESVRGQTVEDWEVIVVDDGSTDAGATVVEELSTIDRRIRLIRKANGGVSAARNDALREARGKFVAFLDSDDLWRPSHLESLLPHLKSGRVDVAVGKAAVFDDSSQRIVGETGASKTQISGFPDTLFSSNFIVPTMVVARLEIVEQIGFFNEEPSIQHAEDWDFWLRSIAIGVRFQFHPEITVFYRKHGGAASCKRLMMYRRSAKMLGRHRPSESSPRYRRWRTTLDRRLWLAAIFTLRKSPKKADILLRRMSRASRLHSIVKVLVVEERIFRLKFPRWLLSRGLESYISARAALGRIVRRRVDQRHVAELQNEIKHLLLIELPSRRLRREMAPKTVSTAL